MLHKLVVEVMAMVDEWSPGSSPQHFFLSRRELAKLSSVEEEAESLVAPEVQYSQARVEEACSDSTPVTEEFEKGNEPEELDDLYLLQGAKF